jgi:hypothetical protein
MNKFFLSETCFLFFVRLIDSFGGGGRRRFFHAREREAKKGRGSVNSRFILPPTLEAWFPSLKPLGRGKSKILE